ncbi:hypothetical protein GWI33_015279 [Rhynchophorus ferrugineus]|uniref:ZZ-type zinc finger-containing protein 3 n=1 Tax=Rhynchophorus ferrugineus TaxID=354439 RepID=A0A834MBK5_RHYFE|nr:hypothetical protein GWI33_015279 [Rhynchophorus ferrugineus]
MDEMVPLFNTEDDLFSFETDHLALKGNKDYCEVLKTLVVLGAQREQALKDYKTVSEERQKALADPINFIKKMQNGESLGLPTIFELPKLPKIDFQKYNINVSESELLDIYSNSLQNTDEKLEIKSSQNNRSWTTEEQKRLEELLQVYPPEPVEMKRYQKIAKALGTRTYLQVASRVQKYFLKLYKAGLPIPGRVPKSSEKYKKSSLHKHQRRNHYLWKPTTFFPELNVPVQMDNLEDIPGPSSVPTEQYSGNTNTENYLLRTNYHNSSNNTTNRENSHEQQLNLLKRVRQEKVKEDAQDYVPFSHVGYKCDYCDEDPIIGSRWHCIVCPDSVDYCTDCVPSQLYSENPHPLGHWLAIYNDDSENYSFPEDYSDANQIETKSDPNMSSDENETSD